MVTQPMTMPAQAQAMRHRERVLARRPSSALEHAAPADALARGRAQQRDRQAGERADQRAQRRRVADGSGRRGRSAIGMNRWPRSRITRAEARQLRRAARRPGRGASPRSAPRRTPRRSRAAPGSSAQIVDLHVGHGEELGHHEGRGAHDRRHDLPAGRRDRLDRGGERRPEAGALHQRDRDRPVDHHVGDRAARDRAEQARADTTATLPGPPAVWPVMRHREVHEELARCRSSP